MDCQTKALLKSDAQRQTAFRSSGIGNTEVDLDSKVYKLFIRFIGIR
jgi:hypothetical protein